jgi:ribosome biogenesis GTPase / thiamine phosphate phosphatase
MQKDEFIFHEESDYFDTKKEGRQARKLAQKKDRSKYKKTDQNKTQSELHDLTLEKGIVVRIQPQQFFVSHEGKTTICSLRGSLKKETTKKKNIVIVGDYVRFQESGDGTGVIYSVEERKSVLSRADHLSQQREHLIAANIDQVIITISVMDPPLRGAIIDRYLIAANKGNLHPIIVCNKIDLLDDPNFPEEKRAEERELLEEYQKIYASIGFRFLPISTKTGAGIDALIACMKDKVSVFSGQSGAGKSSLINSATGLDIRVRQTVQRTKKGAHTTSSATLYPLSFGGWCIDTPGIKSFGVWDLVESDIRGYFSEIDEESTGCKFPDCRHTGEPGCAIPRAIEEGTISILRYSSYLSLLASVQQEHLRR